MKSKLLKYSLLWGFLLWLFGYILGIVLFFVVPSRLIGWVITPFGILATVWVLIKKIHLKKFEEYLLLAVIWLLVAIICDYFFLVKLFNPADGYYKPDVYFYYLVTFILPLIVGIKKVKS